MALQFAHGAIQWLAADANTTVYTVSSLAFQPKALRFYCMGVGSATDTSSETLDLRRSVGFAVSTSDRRCVASFDDDAAGTMICSSGLHEAAVVAIVDGSPAFTGLLDLNSITSDGFTLIVDDQIPADITVFWEAWGGDITVATTQSIAEPAATGNVDYTVTGFVAGAADQVVMFAGVQSTAAAGTAQRNDSGLCVGYASSGAANDNIVIADNQDDGSTTADTDRYALSGECLAMMALAGGNPSARAQMTQYGTNNFRLNWIVRATTNRRYIAMAIKGGGWQVGEFTHDSTTIGNTTTESGLLFQPKGILGFSATTTESVAGTSGTTGVMGLGTASSTSSRRSMGVHSENATGSSASEVNLAIEYDEFIVIPSNAGGVLLALDINAINSDGFQVITDVASAGTHWYGYLAFGDLPTRGRVSQVELEVPFVATRGRVSFAELEVPFVATRGRVSWAELEVPTVQTRGRVSWAEFEVPNAAGATPTRGRVSWVEFEIPFVTTRGRVSLVEFEVPSVATRGRVSFIVLEVPDVGAGGGDGTGSRYWYWRSS